MKMWLSGGRSDGENSWWSPFLTTCSCPSEYTVRSPSEGLDPPDGLSVTAGRGATVTPCTTAGVPAPMALIACAVKVYCDMDPRSSITQDPAWPPPIAQRLPPGSTVTSTHSIGDPPSLAGGDQLIWAALDSVRTVTLRGADGAPNGITRFEVAAGPVPARLLAATAKV